MKKIIILVLIAVLCGVSMAATRVSSLIIDDFESYTTDVNDIDFALSLDYLGTEQFVGTGPWFLLEEIGVWSHLLNSSNTFSNNPFIDANLKWSIKLDSGGNAASTIDPNGFVAYNSSGSGDDVLGVADDLNPQSLKFSYDATITPAGNTGKGYLTLGLTRFVKTMGIPVSDTPAASYPAPFGDIYTADLSVYDKLSFKIKNEPNDVVSSPDTLNDQSEAGQDTIKLLLIGADLITEIAHARVPWDSGPKFLEYPGGVWRTVEFNLAGMGDRTGSGLDLSEVAAVVIEIKDRLGEGRHATFSIDDITLSIIDRPADINMDGAIDLGDLAALAANWLQ